MTHITYHDNGTITVSITLDLQGSLLEMENTILDGTNKIGCLATGAALKRFDSNGSAIIRGGVKWTAKGQDSRKYQTPYGVAEIERHVYQTSQGGHIYCPLEDSARTILSATPKFAQQLSHKYAQGNAQSVCTDLRDNHNRTIARSTVQNVADWVGAIACAQEEIWEYAPPELDEPITTVVLSLDGAYLLMANDGYREAMVGNISLYDCQGERQHTIYLGEAPEYGKACFKERYTREITRIKARYPDALYLGIADGAKDNWAYLTPHTDCQLLDFYHVTEYLAKASDAVHPQKTGKAERKQWLSTQCSHLKHDKNAAQTILEELQRLPTSILSETVKEGLDATITYFKNNIAEQRMDYAHHVEKNLPIGSGVTEAACKTLVKQRLCGSGMRWKSRGAKVVLSLRALVQTTNRWQQFWDKINEFGTDVSLV